VHLYHLQHLEALEAVLEALEEVVEPRLLRVAVLVVAEAGDARDITYTRKAYLNKINLYYVRGVR
jgi:hypothetical protein